MRVLYISSVYKPAYVYGGPARSVPSLCEGLAESGADIEVLTTNAHRRTRLDVPLNRRLEVDGVPVTYFPIVGERYFHAPALVDAVRDQIHRFDIVEIDALFSSLLEPVARVCREAGAPYVVPPRGLGGSGVQPQTRGRKGRDSQRLARDSLPIYHPRYLGRYRGPQVHSDTRGRAE